MQILPSPDLFVHDRAHVGEGPVVDHASGQLVWVDIPAGLLTWSALAGGASRSVSIGMSLGAVGLRADGADGYVAAVGDGLGYVDRAGRLELVHRLLPEPERRMNDAKCDPAGRFLAGSTTLDFLPGEGALHCWDPVDGVRTVVQGLTLPNGLGWSPDGQVFYLADSMRRVILTSRYDLDSGTVGPLRELVSFGTADGLPDGLCVDDDGCLWVAMWGAAELRRYTAAGRQVATVPLAVSQPSSCAFGPDGTLYVTSAADNTDAQREPLAGSVFALGTQCHGVPVSAFGGACSV